MRTEIVAKDFLRSASSMFYRLLYWLQLIASVRKPDIPAISSLDMVYLKDTLHLHLTKTDGITKLIGLQALEERYTKEVDQKFHDSLCQYLQAREAGRWWQRMSPGASAWIFSEYESMREPLNIGVQRRPRSWSLSLIIFIEHIRSSLGTNTFDYDRLLNCRPVRLVDPYAHGLRTNKIEYYDPPSEKAALFVNDIPGISLNLHLWPSSPLCLWPVEFLKRDGLILGPNS